MDTTNNIGLGDVLNIEPDNTVNNIILGNALNIDSALNNNTLYGALNDIGLDDVKIIDLML